MRFIKIILFLIFIGNFVIAVDIVTAATCCGHDNKSYCLAQCPGDGWDEAGANCPNNLLCCPLDGKNCGDPQNIYDQIPEGASDKIMQEIIKEEVGVSEKDTEKDDISAVSKAASIHLNPMNINNPTNLFSRAINALLAFIGSIVLILYIYAGFLWMSSSGNAEQIKKAQNILIWTTLGAIAMASSFMIVRTVLEKIG